MLLLRYARIFSVADAIDVAIRKATLQDHNIWPRATYSHTYLIFEALGGCKGCPAAPALIVNQSRLCPTLQWWL
jgi:hypothetical protein